MIKNYINKNKLDWTLIAQNSNLGYIGNFAFLLGRAAGDYIALCDQDDLWHDDKTAVLCSLLDNNPSMQAAACAYGLIDESGEKITREGNKRSANHGIYPRPLKSGEAEPVNSFFTKDMPECLCNRFIGCSLAIRKSVALQYLSYQSHDIPHDWELCLIAEASGGLMFLNEELMDYRLHSNNTIGLHLEKKTGIKPDEDSRKRLAAEFARAVKRMKEICLANGIEAPKNIERYAENRFKVVSDYSLAAYFRLFLNIKLYRRQYSLRQRLGDIYTLARHKLSGAKG